ncbi:ATP-binding protein [Natronomonas halophila]|uniref:ATP-binding protein n=1 Tax=Natronomonas halophila TaxID=2747817 RepID=UPI0015B4351C|nr:VWA domain-containing protein [Natronomonas halophila]QLD85812.1 ATP-binding protein [Natronomonas halophila]
MFDFAETKSVSTPFGAVVGQERLKEALLTVAADDGLDGLLATGEKGTAKSTLVRGLADLLPDQRAVADCPYGCPPDDRSQQCNDCRERAFLPVETRPVPLVTLPLGATRERVVGTLSVSDALAGETEFDPGLLARANRGILYVDEVNLLDDHLVDVLLDAAASGENRVERDGVSVAHPAEFTLVGTMNPEEGDLRPQLRDRFALSVEVRGERDVEDRVAIIDDNLGDSGRADDTTDYRRRLRQAREMLGEVELTDEQKRDIAELCLEAGVEGHRADIATARSARALAALDGRPTVTDADLERAAELALAHRMQSRPFEDAPDAEDVIDDHFDEDEEGEEGEEADDEETDPEEEPEPEGEDEGEADDREDAEGGEPSDDSANPGDESDDGDPPTPDQQPAPQPSEADDAEAAEPGAEAGDDTDADSDDPEEATPLVPGQQREAPTDAISPDVEASEIDGAEGTGRAAAAPATGNRGTRVRTEPAENGHGVDAAASVRAAASRGADGVETRDLRRSVRSGEGEALVVFAVDASASMRSAMRTAKGVTLDLLEDAYTERDSVSVVAFAGDEAEVLLPPTDSVTLAARHLKDLPTGDRTPLPAGLRSAAEVVDRADPEAAVVVVVSDGRANAADNPTADTRRAAAALAETGARVVCVEAGDERGLLSEVVAATEGDRVPLDALTPERIEQAVANARR